MGRNSLALVAALALALAVAGCGSGGGSDPTKAQLQEQAHHGIDIKKMTPKEISSLPQPAQDAIRRQLAQSQGTTPTN
jgi:hypothetical protein